MNVNEILTASLTKPNKANMNSIVVALDLYGEDAGLLKPHRLAQYLAQVLHESGDFKYDKEIWGPTPAQIRYDTRKDLGNTPEVDGDGKLYMGRSAIQLTGKSNYRQFTKWCKDQGYTAPDFVKKPDLINTDPWEGLVPIWYWTSRNLNTWADQGDIETVTKKINGGLNGFTDRVNKYARVGLAMLGYKPYDLKKFQADRGLQSDGDPGPKTRSAIHMELVNLTAGEKEKPSVTAAPVTEQVEKEVIVDKPVVPQTVEKEVRQKTNWLAWLLAFFGTGGAGASWFSGMDKEGLFLIGGGTILFVLVMLLGGEWIIHRVRAIKKAVEE